MIDEIETLMALVPSTEEEQQLKDYKGEIDNLPRPEKYCIKVK
jgi:hypothetical protein